MEKKVAEKPTPPFNNLIMFYSNNFNNKPATTAIFIFQNRYKINFMKTQQVQV